MLPNVERAGDLRAGSLRFLAALRTRIAAEGDPRSDSNSTISRLFLDFERDGSRSGSRATRMTTVRAVFAQYNRTTDRVSKGRAALRIGSGTEMHFSGASHGRF